MQEKTVKFIQNINQFRLVNLLNYLRTNLMLNFFIVLVLLIVSYIVFGGITKAATLSLSTTATTITITVTGRYTAVMTTNDTDDYVRFTDLAEGSNVTHEFASPHIREAATDYFLRWNNVRKTTILESTPTRVKLRVEGCFDTTGGGACLTDGTTLITVSEDYTFTPEGVFVHNSTNFQETGITLDSDSGHNGYEWLGVYTDLTDAAFNEGATPDVIYGNGNTEVNNANQIDTAEFAYTNQYVVLPGTGTSTYQDAMVGISQTGWFDDFFASPVWEWNWDENDTTAGGTTQDLLTFQDQAAWQAVTGVHQATWFFLLKPETSLDTEAEREGAYNDIVHPDSPSYSTGTVWPDRAGVSAGLSFGGAGYVDLGSGSSLDNLQTWTYESWVNIRGINTDDGSTFVAKATPTTGEKYFGLHYDNTSRLRCMFERSGGGSSTFLSNEQLAYNKWYHVACACDYSQSQDCRMYINGTETTYSSSSSFTSAPSNDAAANMYVGARNAGESAMGGFMDEVRVWNTARTAEQIRADMSRSVSPSANSNLVAYLPLNEGTGSSAFDETSNNNDGTITNAYPSHGYLPDFYNRVEGAYTDRKSVV